ncbi:MAG: SDR family NAD(P)-dependent oxidoreductase [Truepera sp.]|nr:SDR family NAD(P)-dependent oxidoreductase [Truepera sp.]
MSLAGKVAIVTGAASGIGRAVGTELASKGAAIALVDHDAEALDGTLSDHRAQDFEVEPFCANAVARATAERVVASARSRWNRIDILINNVGGSPGERRPLEETHDEDWERNLELNLTSTFHWCRAVVATMKEQGTGSIVNISSQTALTGTHHLIPGYPAAKAGVLGLTRQLARELGPSGIRVNAIAPGLILSGPKVQADWNSRPQNRRDAELASIPLGRLGTPEDVAKVVAFLASADAGYVTGQVVFVSGGQYFG